ncbi:hypothetical protein HELRODRAFT_193012 [Helobdella robusta]|uniref:Uncharacterized protein n=1 Tax=Helobdella robusta TaxID=6412 RepID=T1FUI5_HELRO|nr:hypothetical protein HELRODRAFT_193012 [Helobdella robusta]ESN98244.1 hypothetical protein HELRODRAFT_193012 [Helobdella robusta]
MGLDHLETCKLRLQQQEDVEAYKLPIKSFEDEENDGACNNFDQDYLIAQAEVLFKKGAIYQKIESVMQIIPQNLSPPSSPVAAAVSNEDFSTLSTAATTATTTNIPTTFNNYFTASNNNITTNNNVNYDASNSSINGDNAPDVFLERSLAISSLRFLNIFYSLPSEVFFLSQSLFDSLISKLQVKYYPIVHVSCFFIAVSTCGYLGRSIRLDEVLKFTQCDAAVDQLYSTTGLIVANLQCNNVASYPSSLSILRLFLEIILLDVREDICSEVLADIVSKLEVIACHHLFLKYRVRF